MSGNETGKFVEGKFGIAVFAPLLPSITLLSWGMLSDGSATAISANHSAAMCRLLISALEGRSGFRCREIGQFEKGGDAHDR